MGRSRMIAWRPKAEALRLNLPADQCLGRFGCGGMVAVSQTQAHVDVCCGDV